MKTSELDLKTVLKLLKRYTFKRASDILGLDSSHSGNALRRWLEIQGVDPRQYAKSKKSMKFWFGSKVKEYKTKPKIIKKYRENGYTIKVYEARYARL